MALPVIGWLASIGIANVAKVIGALGGIAIVVQSYLGITSSLEAEVGTAINALTTIPVGEHSIDIWFWASMAGMPTVAGVLITALGTRVLIQLATWALGVLSA